MNLKTKPLDRKPRSYNVESVRQTKSNEKNLDQ